MAIESMYTDYHKYLNDIALLDTLPNFKSYRHYIGILEHTSFNQGSEYLQLIRSQTNLTEETIREFCARNDRVGGGDKYNYGFITTSPSNFRYLFHAHLILRHMMSFPDANIVELGGGYGGLCLAISLLHKMYNVVIKSYSLIDLPGASSLQRRYLAHHSLDFPTHHYSAFNYGSEISNGNNFLISNYCFSEIAREHQTNYITTLFPKIQHGFMVWNHIELYNFGFNYREETEYPLTGSMNKYVYF